MVQVKVLSERCKAAAFACWLSKSIWPGQGLQRPGLRLCNFQAGRECTGCTFAAELCRDLP